MNHHEITAVKGVRNDVSPERFTPGDLVYARNVDIDESGRAQRRAGTAIVRAGAAHSAWSDGRQGFFVQGGQLKRFTPGHAPIAVTPISGSRVAYVDINGMTFWSDTNASGVVVEGANYPLGITPPAEVAPASIAGALPVGGYICTMTFVTADGRESGAPRSSFVRSSGGLQFTSLPVSDDPRVTNKNIYISAADGDLPFLAATVENTANEATITALGAQTTSVRTQFMGPPPSGQVLGYFNGRLYVAKGAFIFYSQPYEYDLFDMRSGFIPMDSDIQTFAAVTDGVYVGTRTRTVFLAGSDPGQFTLRVVAPHGTILGTALRVGSDVIAPPDDGEGVASLITVLWMSTRGLVLAQDNGVVKDLTVRHYTPPPASIGAALLKLRSATPQYVVSLSI